MPHPSIWTRALEGILSIGASDDESESQRSGRRVFMLAFILASLLSVPAVIARFAAGYTWVGVSDLVTLVVPVSLLVVIAVRPTSYVPVLHVILVILFASPILDTAMFGGLLPSGVLVIFGLDIALGALLALGLGAGLVWSGVFALSVAFAVVIPRFVDPIYTLDDPAGNAAFNLIGTGIVTVAVMIYFVRQRDRFQQRSDDLLHAILPDAIVARLKDSPGTIADDVPSASVLFADVVDFTPLSADMTPAALVEMLDELFTGLRRLRQRARAGEDQDRGRRVHGGRRRAGPARRPRRRDRRPGVADPRPRLHRDVRRPSAADADRDRLGTRHGGDHRHAEVRL